MAQKRIFSYAASRGFRRKLDGLASHVTDLPPWLEPPRPADRFTCAFLETSVKTLPVVSAWLTCLTLLHPGIRIWIVAPARMCGRLRSLFSGRVSGILPSSTGRSELERRAATPVRKPRAKAFLTPTEERQIAGNILDSMGESSFLIQDGIICYATVTLFDNLGYTREMVIGHPFLEFIPPHEWERLAAIYESHLSGEPEPEAYETLFNDTAGKAVPAEIIVFGTTFRGRPAVAGTIRSVTERQALREMTGRRERELALVGNITRQLLSGRSLKTSLRSALDLVIDALGADAGTVVLSKSSRGPFVPEAARHRSSGGFARWPACGQIDQVRVFPAAHKKLKAGMPVIGAPCEMTRTLGLHHLTAPLLVKKQLRGFIFVLREAGEPFDEDDASLLFSIANEAAMGVENRRLYEDLQESYRELMDAQRELLRAERLAVIGNMAAHVAHEIRNPVATIMNASGQIRRRLKLEGVEAELADIVEEELERLRRLCDDLVTFSRSPKPRSRAVRLDGFLDFIRSDLLKGHCIPDGVTVGIHVDPPDLDVHQDPDILYPLLRNLVINSIQSMGMKGNVDLGAGISKKKLVLSVSDSGPGIPHEIIDKIFDPFFSTHPESVGLGLAIVKNYVEELGGELDVQSSDEGTTVRMVLPIPSPSSQEPP